VTPEAAPPDARCGDHPDVQAKVICGRCGKFLCAACITPRAGGIFCPPCSKRFLPNLDASALSVGAVICAFAGFGCAPLGLLAVALAIVDIAKVSRGSAPRGGWRMDALAIGLGLVSTAIGATIALTWLGREY
jgi:hypothetical protein